MRPKATLIAKSLLFVMVLTMGMSVMALAAPLGVEVETRVGFETNDPKGKLLPLKIREERHTFRFRGEEKGVWKLRVDAAAEGKKGAIAWKQPAFLAEIQPTPLKLTGWGGGYNLGDPKMDPVELMIMGSNGFRFANSSGDPDGNQNTISAGDLKVRTSFSVADVDITTDVHQLAGGRTNIEAYGEAAVGGANKVGGVLRQGFDADSDKNTTGIVGFGKFDLAGVDVGVSAGARTGKSVNGDNFAFGVTGEKTLNDALILSGRYINRQKNFYEPDAQDAKYQSSDYMFKNVGAGADGTVEGSMIELAGTWRVKANEKRSLNEILYVNDAFHVGNLSAPAYQGVLRISNDGSANAQTLLVGRIGAPLVEKKLFGLAELKVTKDDDGVGSVAGVSGTDTLTQLRGRLQYKLDSVGLSDWFVLGIFETKSTTDSAISKTGSETKLGSEIWYNKGKVRLFGGYESVSKTGSPVENKIYCEYRIRN